MQRSFLFQVLCKEILMFIQVRYRTLQLLSVCYRVVFFCQLPYPHPDPYVFGNPDLHLDPLVISKDSALDPAPDPDPPSSSKNSKKNIDFFQCCGSGMFIPDLGSLVRLFSVPDPRSRTRTVSIPDPGSASKNLSILTQKNGP